GAGQTRPFPRFRLVEARKWSTGKGFRGVYIVSLIGKVLFKDNFTTYGNYDFPLLRKQEVSVDALKLIRFSSIVKSETKDLPGCNGSFF
ncbi:MAG: hypothetical protein LBL86_08430, partial [Coriobacteriales bacterium]|nr:hypothetical protein [Coriobacteriales bacterium]